MRRGERTFLSFCPTTTGLFYPLLIRNPETPGIEVLEMALKLEVYKNQLFFSKTLTLTPANDPYLF
jgi:hypothetical protein